MQAVKVPVLITAAESWVSQQ